jgi:hypothetical protein
MNREEFDAYEGMGAKARRPRPANLGELWAACLAEAEKRVDASHVSSYQTVAQARAGWAHIALSVAVSGKHAAAAAGVPASRIYQHRHSMDHMRAEAEAFGRTLRPAWQHFSEGRAA